jgi:hypothetical protein
MNRSATFPGIPIACHGPRSVFPVPVPLFWENKMKVYKMILSTIECQMQTGAEIPDHDYPAGCGGIHHTG